MSQRKTKAELEDKVFKLKDLNKDLKGKQLDLEQTLKKAQWEASYFRKKAQSATQGKNNTSLKESNELNKMVGILKDKNEQYRKENLKLRENARHTTTKRTTKRPSTARKPLKNKVSQQQITTILKEIQQTMKHKSNENTSDMDKITTNEVRKQLKEKQAQIALLTTKYEQLQSNLKADRIIQQRALDQCQQYKRMLQQTDQTNHELQHKICDLEATQHEIESLRLYIKNIKGENQLLQERISKLTANSLLGDQLESNRISQITSSHHTKLSKIQNELEAKVNLIHNLQKEIEIVQKENNTLKDKEIDLKQNNEILQKENKEMKVKTKLFEDESGINIKDLECALLLIEKAQRNKDNDGLDFLNRIEIDQCEDAIVLRAKIDELLIKNRDLILECTQNQNLLETQINLNKKMEKEYHELDDEYITLRRDHNDIKSEMHRLSVTRNKSNLLVSENELFVKSDIDAISFGTTENLITFKVTYVELNPNCSYFAAAKNANPLTMIIVDFFEFESIYSNIFGGYNPKYDLFCQYKIKMDDFFVEYIENEAICIDFVYKNNTNNKLKIISHTKISLKNLLITPDSCIQSDVELISNDENQEYIGKVSFIAKMLRSVDIHYNKQKKQNVRHVSDECKAETKTMHSICDPSSASTSILHDNDNLNDGTNDNNENDHEAEEANHDEDDGIDSLLEEELNKME